MDEGGETTMLITIRVRVDPAFPGELFLTSRRFVLPDDTPVESLETVSISEVVESVEAWLRRIQSDG